MGRLTKYGNTSHENGVCCTHFMGKECKEVGGECSYGCKWEEEVWSKLAHYEDMEESGRLIEVVRCKDCAVWRSREDGLINCPYCLDLKKDDDFCSYGVVEGDKE